MQYRLRLQLETDTVCLSEHIKGTITVDADAVPEAAANSAVPVAVRVLLRGVEDCGANGTVEHLALVATVTGPPGPGEEAQMTALEQRVDDYATKEGRHNPLPGVAMAAPDDTYAVGGRGHYLPRDPTVPQQSSPSPARAAAPPDATNAPSAAPVVPSAWVAGGHYEYAFRARLPPWMPPSYYYKLKDGGGGDVSMSYTVSAFVATAPATASASSRGDGLTTVLVETVRDGKTPTSATKTAAGDVSKTRRQSSEVAEAPRQTAQFTLPAQAARLIRCLPSCQVRRLTVLSAFPKREFLQCVERVAIPPPFTQKLVFHLYRNSLKLLGLAKAPFTDINVRVTYKSSAAVVLIGRPQSRDHICAALGISGTATGSVAGDGAGDGSAAARSADAAQQQQAVASGGLTVTGTVVAHPDTVVAASSPTAPYEKMKSDDVDTLSDSLTMKKEQQRRFNGSFGANSEAVSDGVLRLRVKVTAGTVSIHKTRIALMERVRLAGSSNSQRSDSYTLASFTYKDKIPANESGTFWVDLRLPQQFRHSARDSDDFPPPAGIATAALRTTTWLQITFPDLHAVPEQLLGENIVMVAEDVDVTDTVPFLPNSYLVERGPAVAKQV